MTPEIAWQIVLTLGVAFGGAFLGGRLKIAKLEERVNRHDEDIKEIKQCLDEHEGSINSHSIQLAVLDTSGRSR